MKEKENLGRSIRGVTICGLILAVWNLVAGAAILILDFPREVHTEWPLWKFGQYSLFIGIINACLFGFILSGFVKFRKLRREED